MMIPGARLWFWTERKRSEADAATASVKAHLQRPTQLST